MMRQTLKRETLVRILASFIVLAACMMPAEATAADRYWIGGSGDWSDGAKWNTQYNGTGSSGVPQTGESVSMSATSALTVNYDLSSLSLGYLYLSDNINFVQSGSTNLSVDTLQMDRYGAGSTTYQLLGGALSTRSEDIGSYKTVTFIQSGGVHTVTDSTILGYYGYGIYQQNAGTFQVSGLYLGYDQGGAGRYELSGTGQLSMGTILLGRTGYYGTGQGTFVQTGGTITGVNIAVSDGGYATFTQSGGSTTIEKLSISTKTTGAGGAYYLSGTGALQAKFEYVGDSMAGSFSQKGGTNIVSETLLLGVNATGKGSYTLESGSLQAGHTLVGHYGSGEFIQSGGEHKVGDQLVVANHAGSTGTYTLKGGILQAQSEIVGSLGAGTFNQSAGMNTVLNKLTIAGDTGSTGAYNLSGGSLSAREIVNNGTLAYSGGTLSATGQLTNNGTMMLSGEGTRIIDADRLVNASTGSISAVGTRVAVNGFFDNAGKYYSEDSVNRFQDVTIRNGGYIQAGKGDQFIVAGNFLSTSESYRLWDTHGATLEFTKGQETHVFSITGRDLGKSLGGYEDNFAWRTLILDRGITLELRDGNLNEGGALYVLELLGLSIEEGRVLNVFEMMGLHLNIYYLADLARNAYLDYGTYEMDGGGFIIPIGTRPEPPPVTTPEPVTLLLLGLGVAGLAGLRRKMQG